MYYSLWYNAPGRPATLWVHYTTSCNTQSSAPEDGRDHRPKHVEPIGIINTVASSCWFYNLFSFVLYYTLSLNVYSQILVPSFTPIRHR